MPVDYSKWDALELSDDSDIEVHPNVDKRSFIRAKQNQIHQQRIDRKFQITTLKYERIVNDGVLLRIDALLRRLNKHKKEVEESRRDAAGVDEVVFGCLIDLSSDASLGDDDLPPAPPGVHAKDKEPPSYSLVMSGLVDQVKERVEQSKSEGSARLAAYIQEVAGENKKVQDLQVKLHAELARLEREEGSKITSESIHTGFNSSHVAKASASDGASKISTGPELLNPDRVAPGSASSGSDADIEDGSLLPVGASREDDDEDIEASPSAKKFSQITTGDYRASLEFISANPSILKEKETDGLLVEAFNAQSKATTAKGEDFARQCVHQALLLQYCRSLGKDGVRLFFQRVQTPNHAARKLFLDDVNSTYARIRSRTAELARQAAEDGDSGDKEQIQLHAVNPGTQINIVTPPPLDQCQSDDERASRAIFDAFPPGLQRALAAGSLDRVNEVLGKMSVDEAELVVEQLGEGGMLSLEEGVIDATTEEGQRQVEEIERAGQLPPAAEERVVEEVREGDEAAGDPGMD